MSRKVDLSSSGGTSGEVALNQKPQQQERTGGVPGGVKKSALGDITTDSLGIKSYYNVKFILQI